MSSLLLVQKNFGACSFSDDDVQYAFGLAKVNSGADLGFYEFYRLVSILYAYKQGIDLKTILFIVSDCDFSGFIDRDEFLGVLDKMNACNKFGLENVKQIVQDVVPE